MKNIFSNFYHCMKQHPQFVPAGKIFLAYASYYQNLAHNIYTNFCQINPQLQLTRLPLEGNHLAKIRNELNECDIFILFYDSDYTQSLGRPPIIQQILPELKKYWQKSCVFKDYSDYFNEAFGVCSTEQQVINNKLLKIAGNSSKFRYYDNLGSELEVNIIDAKWANICGCGNRDLVPGEIATIGLVNGIIKFSGAFLSVVPFAPKYGIITTPLVLDIENNLIVNVKSDNLQLVKDFNRYIRHNSSNAMVEEVGIGTNHAVKLHGINAGFEERHVGLHLGLGGAKSGSDHLDLIFQSGDLFFDQIQVIKDSSIIHLK